MVSKDEELSESVDPDEPVRLTEAEERWLRRSLAVIDHPRRFVVRTNVAGIECFFDVEGDGWTNDLQHATWFKTRQVAAAVARVVDPTAEVVKVVLPKKTDVQDSATDATDNDERTKVRAELWLAVATLASDGNVVTLGYDHEEGVAFVRVTDDTFEASTLAEAVRLAIEAREVQ